MLSNPSLIERLRPVALLATDVDGVLTDGRVTWGADPSGALVELKSFRVKDGLGLGIVRAVGIRTAWITGRSSPVVLQRAAELGIDEVCQRVRNKRVALADLARRLGLEREAVLYVGDDLNDLPAFEAAGVRVAVADADALVRQQADWTTAAPGGRGAVREVVEALLRAQGRWEEGVRLFLERLQAP